jgi:hypothetical protein
MANPDFVDESASDQTGTGAITVSMPGSPWAANQIALLFIATDGGTPTLSTPNGFVLAQDPSGNTASFIQGTATGMHVFWKRLTGTNTTSDPAPIVAAPSGYTIHTLHINTYSGCRTSGVPFHIIAKQGQGTATTTCAPPAVTPTLNGCTLVTCCSSANDDGAFNAWTFSGAASPSGQIDNGWHGNAAGKNASFVGGRGGYATAAGARSGTGSFSTASVQAQITMVLASLPEVAGITGNAAGTLAGSTAASAGTVSVSGSEAQTLSGSTAVGAGVAAIAANEAATLGSSSAAITGVVSSGAVGSEAATLAGSSASETGTVAVVGSEAASLASSSASETGAVSVAGAAAGALSGSSASFAGTVPATGAENVALGGSTASSSGTVATSAAPTLGAVAFRQKASTTSPTTGTLTTLTVYPAWTTSTSYNLAQAVRVTNAGNCYELAQTGTSASSGPGPNTTGAGITDGGAKWNFLSAGTGACDTQTSGSMFLATVARGNDATSGTAPTDNKSNNYPLINKRFYASFPGSAAAVYSATLPAAGGTGHTLSAAWGASDNFGGDEITEVIVEVVGGTHIQDHSHSEPNPVSNVCTSASVTTTGPALLVAFLWLNGTVQADGFLHTAIPGAGWTKLPLATGLMEIGNGAGQIQMATMVRTVGVGTFSAVFTTANGEGGIVHLMAIQGAASASGAGAATLSSSSAAETGTVAVTGTDAGVLAGSSGAAAGVVLASGSAAATLGSSVANSVGLILAADAGNEAAVLSGSTAASAGGTQVTGSASARLGGSSAVSAASVAATGAAAGVLGSSMASSFGTAFSGTGGNVAGLLAGSTGAAGGAVSVGVAGAGALSGSVLGAAGTVSATGSVSATLGGSTAASSGTVGSSSPTVRLTPKAGRGVAGVSHGIVSKTGGVSRTGGVRVALPSPSGEWNPQWKDNVVDFDRDAFTRFIDDKGYIVVWEKAVLCPNVPGTGLSPRDHAIGCPICSEFGYIYVDPVPTKMLMQGIRLNQSFFAHGRWDMGNMMVTGEPEFTLDFFDRLTLGNGVGRFTQRIVRQPGAAIDKLRYAPLCFRYVGWVDRSGVLAAFEPDVDFRASVDGSGIEWSSSAPDAGSVYSVSYDYRPRYVVMDLIHHHRDSTIEGQHYQFPVQAMAKLDSLIRNESADARQIVDKNPFE